MMGWGVDERGYGLGIQILEEFAESARSASLERENFLSRVLAEREHAHKETNEECRRWRVATPAGKKRERKLRKDAEKARYRLEKGLRKSLGPNWASLVQKSKELQ